MQSRSALLTGLLAIFVAIIVQAQSDDAPGRVIGLLALPEVFGNGPCDRFEPKDVALYDAADAAQTIGAIRVHENWKFAEEGGCEGLRVGVDLTGATASQPLPTEEYDYDFQGLVVLERRDSWFKIRLTSGAAWLRSSSSDAFQPLEQLLIDRMVYFTDAWSGQWATAAAEALRPASGFDNNTPIRVVKAERVNDELWLHVEVLSASLCEGGEPVVIDRGWLPAHGKSNAPSIWFYSRGC